MTLSEAVETVVETEGQDGWCETNDDEQNHSPTPTHYHKPKRMNIMVLQIEAVIVETEGQDGEHECNYDTKNNYPNPTQEHKSNKNENDVTPQEAVIEAVIQRCAFANILL